MPQRVSAVQHEYAGRVVQVDEEFEVDPLHVPLMLALGRIRPVEGERDCVGREYLTRDMVANRAGRVPRRNARA